MTDVNLRLMCCASCGIAEVDDVKLKLCSDYHESCLGCDLVRYCSDTCQDDHFAQHHTECTKRVIELHGEKEVRERWVARRDEILFKQPESSHFGDCPICCLPIPLNDEFGHRKMSCCSKLMCNGCAYADSVRQERENIRVQCPFCRHPVPKTKTEADKIKSKRAEEEDPYALIEVGLERHREGDYEGAFEYFTKASLCRDGDSVWIAEAHFSLGALYREGEGVEKDGKKVLYHYGVAAVAGHPGARICLGLYEMVNCTNDDRAMKHFIINANLGHDQSIEVLKEFYKKEFVSKENFAAALRAHHAAVNATKSPQRDAAAKYFANFI